jgi:two-component system, NarL family, sensor histidine kinase UhpB
MVAPAHGTEGRTPSKLRRMSAQARASRLPRTVALPAEVPEPQPLLRRRRMSLYVRVVLVNAVILIAATVLLVFTPATVSFPARIDQGFILGGGLAILIVANAVLVRISFRGLVGLVQRMETLDLLQPRQRLAALGGPETRALIDRFNSMLDRLEEERRLSAQRAFSALEGERRRVGQELHDEIGQRLTGILLQLARIADDAPEPVRARIAEVQAETRSALDEVGALAWQIRPGVLDDLGLPRALEALSQTLGDRSPTRIEVRLPASLPTLPDEVELAVYRIAQESLNNALRHAAATKVSLELRHGEDGLSLEVGDDGRGLGDLEMLTEGPGLRGMRERALLIGARLRIDSPFGQGARVRLHVPREQLED